MHSCYKGVFDNLKLSAERETAHSLPSEQCETIHGLLSSVPLVNMFESTFIQS